MSLQSLPRPHHLILGQRLLLTLRNARDYDRKHQYQGHRRRGRSAGTKVSLDGDDVLTRAIGQIILLPLYSIL